MGQQLTFKCQHCEYENINKVTFQKHCNTKHASVYMGSDKYGPECTLCSDKFTTTEAFNEHKADHLKEIESMDVTSLPNGHDIFGCNLCSFESGHDDSVKAKKIQPVQSGLYGSLPNIGRGVARCGKSYLMYWNIYIWRIIIFEGTLQGSYTEMFVLFKVSLPVGSHTILVKNC